MEYHVDGQSIADLRKIARGLGLAAKEGAPSRGTDTAKRTKITFLGTSFIQGEDFRATSKPETTDAEEILRWVRDATRHAGWVIVSLHSHEEGATRELPADFVRTFAHACIDAGAHVFAGHGPHFLRGIEIYKRRPIFYSLGNLFFQLEGIPWHPRDAYDRLGLGYDARPSDFYPAYTADETKGFPADSAYWRSVIAVCKWKDWALDDVVLRPIDMRQGHPWGQRGRPVLADAKVGREILRSLAQWSSPFGTSIRMTRGPVGHIALPAGRRLRSD